MNNSAYKWWLVAMLWFVCFFNYADRQAIFSVFPLLQKEMGLSDIQLGIVGSSFMWVYAAAGPFAGWIGDRFSRKAVVLGGLIAWSLVTIATALSTKYWHLVTFRGLEGLGEAFYFPASMALISAFHNADTRSRAMSLHQSSVYAGTIAGGTFAGLLGQHYGWRSGFYVFGIAGTLLGLLLWKVIREPEAPREKERHVPIRAIFDHPMVPVLIATFIGANFVALIFLTWLPSYLVRNFQMTLSMAGFSATAYLQLASVLGVLTGGWLADRLSASRRGGRAATQALGLLGGVPFLFLTGWTLDVSVLILAMIGFGFCKGLYDANIWATLYDYVPEERRATAVGLMNSLGWLGGGIAPVAIAAASSHYGMAACLSATSAIYFSFGTFLLLSARRWAPR
ncbi:MAG: MFS transporter [Acidobacteria bacterium]|nr:MFS transporter [Acidobacteriota bacterium]